MDLRVHAAVLWRFRLLMGAGVLLALLLAILSIAKIGSSGVTYRDKEQWLSHETLLVSQTGFPIGQSVLNEVVPLRTSSGSTVTGDQGNPDYIPRYADTGRFSELAVLYARLANSDPVERLLFKAGPIPGAVSISAAGVSDQAAGPLPLIEVSGVATTAKGAKNLTHRAATALKRYIATQQAHNNVPEESRVLLTTVKDASDRNLIEDGLQGTMLIKGHSKLRPMLVFVAVFGLFAAIAFVLENLRPRLRLVEAAPVSSNKRKSA
jgi:hypothetical protein